MTQAVLFDFDLTLADSADAVIECANHALRAMALPERPRHEVAATIGLPPRETFRLFTGESDPQRLDQYLHHWVARADEVTLDLVTLYPDAPDTLALLRARGLRTGIVSTRYRYRIEAILAHRALPHAFDVILGGDDVASHKPDPEGLLRALERLNLGPRDAVYVGDHLVDAQAAARAGVPFIGVLTGHSSRHDLLALGAARVCDSLAQLSDALASLPHR